MCSTTHQWNENGQEMSEMEAIRKMQSHSKTKDRTTMYDTRIRRSSKRKMRVTLIEANEFSVLYEIETAAFFFPSYPTTHSYKEQKIAIHSFDNESEHNEKRWSMVNATDRGCSMRIKWNRRTVLFGHIAAGAAVDPAILGGCVMMVRVHRK